MQVKNKSRSVIFFTLVAIGAYVGLAYFFGWPLPGLKPRGSYVPSIGALSDASGVTIKAEVKKIAFPSDQPSTKGVSVREWGYIWNARMAMMLANGGITTTKGSLMEKYGINLTITSNNETDPAKDQFLKFCKVYSKEFKAGNAKANPSEGIQLFSIMGDGAPAIMESLIEPLAKLGLTPEIIGGSSGLSLGEDKYVGPKEWKDNPQLARGSLCAVVPRDGDQNLPLLFAKRNQIPVNTDSRYIDLDAINFYEVKGFMDAGTALISGKSVTLPTIKGGKVGKPITKKVDSAATWTPMDEKIVTQKGGVVTIYSTKENKWQMPCTFIGVKEWDEAHHEVIEGMLAAIFQSSDQIRTFPEALDFAAGVAAKVFGIETAEYWKTFWKGKMITDTFGNKVEVGGSAALNLADNLYMFGLLPENTDNIYARTYKVCGDAQKEAYPTELPKYPPIEQVLNLRYLKAVAAKFQDSANYASSSAIKQYDQPGAITQVDTKTKLSTITFVSGSDQITPEGIKVLEGVIDDLAMTEGYIEFHGHTDNIGGEQYNLDLSQRRADAVKSFVQQKAPGLFGKLRVEAIGHGLTNPVASNGNEPGRKKNRRVEIVVGKKTT